MTVHGPADGWVESPEGQKYWGRAGAAGLLVVDERDRVLLQHRAVWSHHGGTWGLPGGARAFGETAVEGALRESGEEAAVPADALRLVSESVLDLGFWSYTTVVARAERPFEPVISDAESLELRWVPRAEIASVPLHPGLAGSWAGLDAQLDLDVHLVVDAANVVGSRPDGWWRDRAGATRRLLDRLVAREVAGLPADLVVPPPASSDASGTATSWWPRVTVVVEGAARAVTDDDLGRVRLVRAEADGDAAIAAVVDELRASSPSPRVVVATADRGLAARVEARGGVVVGPGRLLSALD